MFTIFYFLFLNTLYAAEFPGASEGLDLEKGITALEKEESESNRLLIGGTLDMRMKSISPLDSKSGNSSFSNPNQLYLYLDSKQKEDIRFFAKGVYTYTPTADDVFVKKNVTDLMELKLQFNAQKKIFFTVGRQKIKWGSGRFYNPSDFLNSTVRNPLEVEDKRLGLNLIKMHLPVDRTNLYFIGGYDDADKVKKTVQAARIEQSLNDGEVAVTVMTKDKRKTQMAFDGSKAVGPIDLYLEGAVKESSKEGLIGFEYQFSYGNEDKVTLFPEYLYSDINFKRYHSAGLGISLPKLFALNKTDLLFLNMANMTTNSYVSMIQTTFTHYSDLTFRPSLSYLYGGTQNSISAEIELLVSF